MFPGTIKENTLISMKYKEFISNKKIDKIVIKRNDTKSVNLQFR
jgi:hypothetical protein